MVGGERGSVLMQAEPEATNYAVAAAFRALADRLEREHANPFRVRAYRRAAANVERLREDVRQLAAEDRLREIRGIGRDLSARIVEFIETGGISTDPPTPQALLPAAARIFVTVPGITPRVARYLSERLQIQTIEDLGRLARSHLLRTVPGVGADLERRIIAQFSNHPAPADP